MDCLCECHRQVGTVANMISHELAKELMDAGFPQEAGLTDCEDAWLCCQHTRYLDTTSGNRNDEPYRPTLSELIESCGERFHYVKLTRKDAWSARAKWLVDSEPMYSPYCKTPEEAVARLWLALNRKDV